MHDLAFDWYGQRLATCSSDARIRVWEWAGGRWQSTGEMKAHSGSVLRLSWAHPEFGTVLASCSSDRMVHVWEEAVEGRSGARQWKKQARLVDSRDAVSAVAFAPRHLGLKLATCSLDGRVRIYESADVQNLSVWPLTEEIDVMGGSAAAGGGSGGSVAARVGGSLCMSWNHSPFDAPSMVVAAERDVKLWEYSAAARRWASVATLDGHTDAVHDVAWAPNVGRAYHLIATACKDGCVRIFELRFNKSSGAYVPSLAAKLSDHSAEVWRVSWNATGSILASTGDDGVARLWKADFNGTWHPILVAAATPANASAMHAAQTNANATATAAAHPSRSQTLNSSAPVSSFGAAPVAGAKGQPSAFGAIPESEGTRFADHRSFF